MLLPGGAFFFESAEAVFPAGLRYTTLRPTLLDTTGPTNITYLLRGTVDNMGNSTAGNFLFFVGTGPGPELFESEVTVVGALFQTPEFPLVEFEVDLEPEATFVVQFLFNDSGVYIPAQSPGPSGVVVFETPAVGAPVIIEDHPLQLELAALGVPPVVGLFMIGVAILVLSLGVVVLAGRGDDTDLFIVMSMAVSANVFLKFWPAIVGIFLWLFVGWVFVTRLTSGANPTGID